MDVWEELGVRGRRALIVHHDDLGLTEAQNAAYRQLGFPTGSVLTPAAWAPQLAGESGADLGVHLTLTSEWAFPRMRPLTGGRSLRDAGGYFWRTVEEVWQHVRPEEARAELEAQVEAALALGIDVTHLDTHMGAVLRPDLARIYQETALRYGLPAMLPESLEGLSIPDAFRPELEALLGSTPLPRVRVLDAYGVLPARRTAWYVQTLAALGPGVYHLIHHAALATPEGMALPDWERRRADLQALADPRVRQAIGDFVPLTYRQVRDALRRRAGQGAAP